MPSAYDDLQKLLMWCTRGENCSICNSLRGRVYSYDMWASSGVWPGFHYRCDCFLKPVDAGTKTSDPDFFGTDLKLLSETLNPDWGPLRLHWDANYQPFSWYMTQQIKEAHITYGAARSIDDVLRNMKDEFQGFFKRSKVWDNFFVWRTFRTVQHYQQIDNDGYKGEALLPYLFKPWSSPRKSTKDTIYGHTYQNMVTSTLKPDSIKPMYPYQSNYTERY